MLTNWKFPGKFTADQYYQGLRFIFVMRSLPGMGHDGEWLL